jgi:hypothetical protein
MLIGKDCIKGRPKLGCTTYSGTGKYINEGCIMVNWDALPDTDLEWAQIPNECGRAPAGTKDIV